MIKLFITVTLILFICTLLWAAWTIPIQGQTSDRPNLIMLHHDNLTTCIATGNTLGYGLAVMKENTSLISPSPTFEYMDLNGESIGNKYKCGVGNDKCNFHVQIYFLLRYGASNELPFAPIIDERWDNFEIYRTYSERDKHLTVYHKYDKSYYLRSNFYYGISIRSNSNAQIVLCNGTHPRKDACYWIIIDGFQYFNETVIRKCIKGVPEVNPKNDPDCSSRQSEKIEKLLDASKWKHFLLTKDENRIRLWAWNADTKEKLLLDYKDDDNPLSPNKMYLRSLNSMVEWKVHDYTYITSYTKRSLRNKAILNISFPKSVCLSLYVTLCKDCKMHLDIIKEGEVDTIASAIVTGDPQQQYYTWKNIRLQSGRSNPNFRYMLKISLIIPGHDGFWGMDDIRICSINESRRAVTWSNEPVICHSLKYPDWTFDSNKEIQNYEPPVCDNLNIGPNCNISCTNCSGNKICLATPIASSEAACTCAPGYQWNNNNCNTKCQHGYYGYRCEKKCGKCQNKYQCNIVNGTCDACEEGYLPPLCQQSLPYLVDAPKSVTVLYSGAIVRLDNVAMKGDESQAAFIQLECREDEPVCEAAGKWFICSKQEPNIKTGIEIEVTNLNRDTKYQIRAVVLTTSGAGFRNYLTTEVIETRCKPLSENNIVIQAQSRNATVSFETDDDAENCDIKKYYISIDNNMKHKIKENNTFIKELTPHRKYTLEISHQNIHIKSITKTFWTAQRHSNVTKLRCSMSSIQFDVYWEEREEENGEHSTYQRCQLSLLKIIYTASKIILHRHKLS